ncbi:MAG: polymer-forming cytoskeletal protein [Candidatus Falkowbacteria bacterium]|nr:polymer-forming cytoskeletal protein [Candidatus Falkowbacteria bacterium]
MSKTRISFLIGLAALAMVLVIPLSAKAIMFKADDSTYIAKDQVVSGSLFAAGSSITVDGKVQGDLICAGQSITVNGTVDGDVICAGQSITINGNVGGTVRAAGNSIVIAGKVSRNVMAAGASVSLAPNAQIGWDLQFASAMTEIRGKVNRDVDGAGANTIIAGNVGRNVYLMLDDNRQNEKDNQGPTLTVTKEAAINGSLTYHAKNDAKIEDGSSIKGSVEKKALNFDKKKTEDKGGMAIAWLWYIVLSIFAAVAFGLVVVSLMPKTIEGLSDLMLAKPWPAIGWGFAVLFLTPFAVIILMITMIGLPIGLTLLALWILLMYPAKILVAIMLGRKITDKCRLLKRYKGSLIASMIFGIIVAWLIFSIPVIGWFLSFVAILWGMGGVWRYARLKA